MALAILDLAHEFQRRTDIQPRIPCIAPDQKPETGNVSNVPADPKTPPQTAKQDYPTLYWFAQNIHY